MESVGRHAALSAFLGRSLEGLPALFGVLLGILIFAGGVDWVFGTLLVLAVAALCCTVGCQQLPSRPAIGRWLIEAWIVSAVGVSALATAILLWIGLQQPPAWLASLIGLQPDEVKSVTAAFFGALAAFLAFAWTKDSGDAKGPFWPSTQFKAGFRKVSIVLDPPPRSGRLYEVMNSDFAHSYNGEKTIDGWGFGARSQRLSEFEAALKRTSP